DRVHGEIGRNGYDDRSLTFDLRGVDGVGFREQHHRPGTTVESEHKFTLEPPWVHTTRCRVQQKDDVDVRGHDVGNRACPLERRPTHEGRGTRRHLFDTLAVCVDCHVVADGDLGTDVAHPCFVARAINERTPAPVEAADPPLMGIFCAHPHER
ncbi:MAG: hypothetical protein RI908_259, partial [Actinomycetota bacterium]